MDFKQFTQNYELKQILGHGTQSTVRKIIRRDTRQIFAAKIYDSVLIQARQELEMLVRLDHPSIVNVYEVYQQQNCLILILDYMAGGELYDQICQKKRLQENQVRRYIKILIDAVRYCHQMGVIHRDIKPENLLLTTNCPDSLLKLSDFGISKILSDQMLNTICGTPIYMAPEIWMMQKYCEKVDIWSIGVVTYFLLLGEYPFTGETTQVLLNKVCNEQIRFESEIWDSISSRGIFDDNKAKILIRSMLDKDPVKRPTAEQVENHIWFSYTIPKNVQLHEDPNLFEALIKISREKVKTKKIKKQREIKQMCNPSKKMPIARAKFLLSPEESSSVSTIASFISGMLE